MVLIGAAKRTGLFGRLAVNSRLTKRRYPQPSVKNRSLQRIESSALSEFTPRKSPQPCVSVDSRIPKAVCLSTVKV